MQALEALWLAGIMQGQVERDAARDPGLSGQCRQRLVQGAGEGTGVGLVMQGGELVGQGLEGFGLVGAQCIVGLEQQGVVGRADRETVMSVPGMEAALFRIKL
ncbi:hypothetical protein D3C84_270980 [compost metagenome]